MPAQALSLLGFMDQARAINHLKAACVPAPNTTDQMLIAEWTQARANLGAAIANAGQPSIQGFPAAHMPYLQTLLQQPWVVEALQQAKMAQVTFDVVEVDPLLSFQFLVDTSRAAAHCATLT